jgi:hypothetical protein
VIQVDGCFRKSYYVLEIHIVPSLVFKKICLVPFDRER